MNVLKIFKLNFGIVDDRLGCLDDILGKLRVFKTALMQELGYRKYTHHCFNDLQRGTNV